jgi:hypothetical protein
VFPCEHCHAALASGLWRLKLRPKGKKLLKLCAACGFSAHGWTRFRLWSGERADGARVEQPYVQAYVKECKLVRSFTAYGAQR